MAIWLAHYNADLHAAPSGLFCTEFALFPYTTFYILLSLYIQTPALCSFKGVADSSFNPSDTLYGALIKIIAVSHVYSKERVVFLN